MQLNENLPLRKLSLKKARLGKKRLKDYGKVLLAKQLLRALYNNPREKLFKKYFGKEKSMNEVIGKLSSRLEIVLTAMGGAKSNNHARQLINHGKISVNGHIIKERGFLLKDGDIVSSAVNFVKLKTDQIKNIDNDKFLNEKALIVASIKPKKIPSYLKLNAPLSANLLVNTDLNYGIFYSKEIKLSKEVVKRDSYNQTYNQKNKKVEKMDSLKAVGLGWKNTNVKSIKTLLLDMKTAKEDEKMKLCAVLYNLVQAYYSRVR